MPTNTNDAPSYRLLLVLLAVMFFSGCAASPPMEQAAYKLIRGDYRGAQTMFDEQGITVDTWGKAFEDGRFQAYEMVNICNAYFKQRLFGSADECIESYRRVTYAQEQEILDGDDIREDSWAASGVRYHHVNYDALKTAMALEFGNFKSAYEHGDRAVELNRSDMDDPESQLIGIDRSSTLQANVAIAAHHQGHQKQAYQLIESIAELEVVFGDVETTEATVHKNSEQARAYLAIGDYEKAGAALEQSLGMTGVYGRIMAGVASLGMTEFLWGEEFTNPFLVNQFFMRTKICFELGDYECARAGYDAMISGDYGERLDHLIEQDRLEAEENASLLRRPAVLYTALYDRGRIALAQGDHVLALEDFTQAIDVIEAQRSSINTEASKIGFVGDKEVLYRDTVALLIEMQRFDEAFVYAERAKARALVDTLASKQSLGRRDDQPSSELLVETIQQDENQLASAGYAISGKQRGVDRALRKKNQQSLINAQPELASLVTVSAPDLAELQALLAADETLLEYYGDSDNLYVFVLSKRGVSAVKLNAGHLADDVSAFRAALSDPSDGSYRLLGQSLYERLVAPVAASIQSTTVTVVPHGILHYLPFGALLDSDQFMIDQYYIRVLPSASVMKFINKGTTAPNDLLALGNPDVDDPELDLPGAQLEAEAIVRGFKRAQLLVRKQATETSVKTQGKSFKRLHFASHGLFDAEEPLASGLLLAADDSNDGLLTVGELYDLELNADLITLSACETALGQISNGDDVVGFTRGFLYAGADSIVSSLWKVDDAATNQLMQSFYVNLNKQDKRSALRTAQLNVKKNHKHPYYWAAFQLTGAVN